MNRSRLIAHIAVLALVLAPSSAFALSTTYQSIKSTKTFGTFSDFVFPTGTITHTCGGGGGSTNARTFKLLTTQTNQDQIFRVLSAALLSGRAVSLDYSCSGTEARISGVRSGED